VRGDPSVAPKVKREANLPEACQGLTSTSQDVGGLGASMAGDRQGSGAEGEQFDRGGRRLAANHAATCGLTGFPAARQRRWMACGVVVGDGGAPGRSTSCYVPPARRQRPVCGLSAVCLRSVCGLSAVCLRLSALPAAAVPGNQRGSLLAKGPPAARCRWGSMLPAGTLLGYTMQHRARADQQAAKRCGANGFVSPYNLYYTFILVYRA
jgi:hypothetical protein